MTKFLLFFAVFITSTFATIHLISINSESEAFHSLLSPLSDLVTKEKNVLASTDLWKPNEQNKNSSHLAPPELGAYAILSYDLTTDTLLYERNIHERIPI